MLEDAPISFWKLLISIISICLFFSFFVENISHKWWSLIQLVKPFTTNMTLNISNYWRLQSIYYWPTYFRQFLTGKIQHNTAKLANPVTRMMMICDLQFGDIWGYRFFPDPLSSIQFNTRFLSHFINIFSDFCCIWQEGRRFITRLRGLWT